MYDICPIGKEFFFNSIQFATQHNGFKFTFKPVGKTASFGKKFEADIRNLCVVNFAYYKYTVHGSVFELTDSVVEDKFLYELFYILV